MAFLEALGRRLREGSPRGRPVVVAAATALAGAAGKTVFSYHDDPERFLGARPDLVLIRPMIARGYPRLVLRLKRSQRAEAIAGEAGVNMLLPGILVMAACVLVILGPFVLGSIASGFF